MSFSLANFSAQTPGMPPDIQLASSDPLAWEKRWEQAFTVAKGRWSVAEECLHKFAISPYIQNPKNQEATIRCTHSLRNILCDLQTRATYDASPFLAKNELQRRWMSASPARRGEIILAGLVAACTNVPPLHDARLWCEKEMSVESHRQDPRLFLELLEEMMVPNPTVAAPTYISNPEWDAIAASQQSPTTTVYAKIALAKFLGERNLLIGYVVTFALCSILDLPLPELYQMKSGKPSKSQEIQPSEDRVRAACGEEASKAFSKVVREMGKGMYAQKKEVYESGKQYCQTCRKPNDTTTKYPRCKRCWDTVERQVVYCSSECQKVDWKAGHKKECGKQFQLEDLTPSIHEQQSPQIGPRLSGFKRPGALLFQVAQLRLYPAYDYLIFLEEGQAYFSFPHPPIRAAFRTCRDKAMTTGDRHAVAMLAHFLLFVDNNASQLKKIGVDPDDMMEQIQTEYDFPEILRAVDEMGQRMSLDSAQRPPLIVDGGISATEWKAIPSTWLDVGIVPSSRNRV